MFRTHSKLWGTKGYQCWMGEGNSCAKKERLLRGGDSKGVVGRKGWERRGLTYADENRAMDLKNAHR